MRLRSTLVQEPRRTRTRPARPIPAARMLALAAVLAVSGCGGRTATPTASARPVRTDAASVCATARAAVDAVSAGPQTILGVMKRLAPIMSREATQLRAIPLGAGVQAAFEAAVRTAMHRSDAGVLTEVAVTGCMAAKQGRAEPSLGP